MGKSFNIAAACGITVAIAIAALAAMASGHMMLAAACVSTCYIAGTIGGFVFAD